MIRVAALDPHPATARGIEAILEAHAGLVPVGAAPDEHALWPLLRRTCPDVVLLHHDADDGDALALCRRIKACLPAPKVVLYVDGAGVDPVVPATLAGADGLVEKAADIRELVHAIRAVAALAS